MGLWPRERPCDRPSPCLSRRGSNQTVAIVYGMPGVELFEAEERGEVELGGCIPGDERWHCRHCGHDWRQDGGRGPFLA